MTDPTVVQLRAFAAVARHRHFGAAADDLSVTQPAVSAAVASLEAGLGAKLFERTPRGVILTALGEQLLPLAHHALAALNDLVADASRFGQAHHGPLRLGVIPTVAPYLLPTILEAFGTRFPALVPEVTEAMTGTLLAALESGTLDLLVMALPGGKADTVELPLYWEEFVLLVHDEHRLAAARGLPTTTLQGLDVLLLEEGHCMRDQTIDVCRQAGAAVGQAVKMASLTTVSQLVAARLGVTLLPASAVPIEVRGPLSTAHFGGSPLPGRHVGMVRRRSSARAGEYAELAEALREAITSAGLPVVIERAEVTAERGLVA
ncbi:MAG: hydrogen peroxide-inducible genes activator [Acidimicrobiales bacterium]|jgi:LysR family hydrogen peroxide-inducible transcriptional activator